MAYFVKKTKRKNDVYLQIYESHHDPVKKYAVHSSVEVLGYKSDLIAQGIKDPFAYAQEKVDDLNRELREARQAKDGLFHVGSPNADDKTRMSDFDSPASFSGLLTPSSRMARLPGR